MNIHPSTVIEYISFVAWHFALTTAVERDHTDPCWFNRLTDNWSTTRRSALHTCTDLGCKTQEYCGLWGYQVRILLSASDLLGYRERGDLQETPLNVQVHKRIRTHPSQWLACQTEGGMTPQTTPNITKALNLTRITHIWLHQSVSNSRPNPPMGSRLVCSKVQSKSCVDAQRTVISARL